MGSAHNWFRTPQLVVVVVLIKVTTGIGRSIGIGPSELWEPARVTGSVCLKLASLWVAVKRLFVEAYFSKEIEVLAVSTTFFNQQIFHSGCLATCLVKYMVFTGAVCRSYIHLCEYSVQILIKVLKHSIEAGSLEELS